MLGVHHAGFLQAAGTGLRMNVTILHSSQVQVAVACQQHTLRAVISVSDTWLILFLRLLQTLLSMAQPVLAVM